MSTRTWSHAFTLCIIIQTSHTNQLHKRRSIALSKVGKYLLGKSANLNSVVTTLVFKLELDGWRIKTHPYFSCRGNHLFYKCAIVMDHYFVLSVILLYQTSLPRIDIEIWYKINTLIDRKMISNNFYFKPFRQILKSPLC